MGGRGRTAGEDRAAVGGSVAGGVVVAAETSARGATGADPSRSVSLNLMTGCGFLGCCGGLIRARTASRRGRTGSQTIRSRRKDSTTGATRGSQPWPRAPRHICSERQDEHTITVSACCTLTTVRVPVGRGRPSGGSGARVLVDPFGLLPWVGEPSPPTSHPFRTHFMETLLGGGGYSQATLLLTQMEHG